MHTFPNLDMVTKPINEHICIKISYITNVAFLLHISVIFVAIFWEVRYKLWIHQDITNVCDPMHRCKILRFNNTYFDTYFKPRIVKT